MSDEEFAAILNHFMVGVAGCPHSVTREPCYFLRPYAGLAFGRLGQTSTAAVVFSCKDKKLKVRIN